MKRPRIWRRRTLRRLARLLPVMLALTIMFGTVASWASDSNQAPAWSKPAAMALKRASSINSSPNEPNFLSNLDCTSLDFRQTDSNVTQTGCFTFTSFGAIDSDNDMTIFNGTDEGSPLLPYSAHQVLVPWTLAENLLTLDATNTGGSYVGLYKDPLSVMVDQRDFLGRLTAEQLTAPPDLSIETPDGKPLVINPQTLAFSDNGSWMVAETLSGAFIRMNLASLEISAFAPAYSMSGSPSLLKSQVAISDDGKYVAVDNDAASEFKVYDLTDCDNTGSGWQDLRCASHDYLPFIKQQVSGLSTIRHLRFINKGLLSFNGLAGENSAVYELAPTDSIKSLINYLALGDSYTSGEGASDYLNGTDTADNMCHLSANSYPLLLTRALFGTGGGHSVACSGAEINDVGSNNSSYRGQVKGVASFEQLQGMQAAELDSIMSSFSPGYVAQQRFVRQYQPAVMTVSVGGNDIGFGDIVKNCVTPHISLHRSDNDCYNAYEDRLELTQLIDRTVPRWIALYKELAAEAPGARLYVIGYPQTVSDTGNCALNVHLSQNELGFVEQLTDYLNKDIQQAAVKAGITYVDISQALAGHRLCETTSYNVAVNGLTAGKDGAVLGIRVFGKESYHPNALGQALIEQAILNQTHNMTRSGQTNIEKVSLDMLSTPKTGRQVNTLVSGHWVPDILRPNSSVPVTASGSLNGLEPRSVYIVKLGGPDGHILGSVTSGNNGDISANITVPADVELGGQTIDVVGQNRGGEPVNLTQPVYVPLSGSDSDGDGIADGNDSCPGAVNSGQDADQDGIDDACDGLIGISLTTDQGDGSGSTGITDGGGSSSGKQDFNNSSGSQSLLSRVGTIVTVFANSSTQRSQAVINPMGITEHLKASRQRAATLNPRTNLFIKKRLPVINWLLWAVILVTLWIFAALGHGISRWLDRSTDYARV